MVSLSISCRSFESNDVNGDDDDNGKDADCSYNDVNRYLVFSLCFSFIKL